MVAATLRRRALRSGRSQPRSWGSARRAGRAPRPAAAWASASSGAPPARRPPARGRAGRRAPSRPYASAAEHDQREHDDDDPHDQQQHGSDPNRRGDARAARRPRSGPAPPGRRPPPGGELGRLVHRRAPPREATSRRAQARSAVRTATASPPGGSSTGVTRRPGSSRRPSGRCGPAAAAPPGRLGLGLVHAVVDVALVGLRRRRGRLVEHGDVVDPVQPEQPDALDLAAPRLQVPVPVDQQQPHRVDGALGALVPAGHVVVQVQRPRCAPARPGRRRASARGRRR